MNDEAISEDLQRRLSPRMMSAVDELENIVLAHYPDTEFHLEAAIDDPDAVHLIATGDFSDHDSVIDLVIDRQVEFLTEYGLPIFVIPSIRQKFATNASL